MMSQHLCLLDQGINFFTIQPCFSANAGELLRLAQLHRRTSIRYNRLPVTRMRYAAHNARHTQRGCRRPTHDRKILSIATLRMSAMMVNCYALGKLKFCKSPITSRNVSCGLPNSSRRLFKTSLRYLSRLSAAF